MASKGMNQVIICGKVSNLAQTKDGDYIGQVTTEDVSEKGTYYHTNFFSVSPEMGAALQKLPQPEVFMEGRIVTRVDSRGTKTSVITANTLRVVGSTLE